MLQSLFFLKISVAIPADLWYMFVLQGGEHMNKLLKDLYDCFYTPPEDTRQKVLSTSERITTLTAELNDGNSKIEEMKAEFNRIVSWSKIFDESPMEVKKMICGYIIKKVSVFRDYRVKIEFNINVEQFLNGIDSIDECATYELPMAQ